ncbi:protein SAWADEE HOMEODOMAIN HOMOLOG 1-like [Phalaenopsis equestris]|uniref:protein SAWADEE HOMEODOMAIN HOMOLOG 1-like n=1 Tax=Phalaenopsis equestris TaxID=78828 RepID=UPI0009E585D1|nr:protein SAWADEE HOMEODOMAIN HOMOLOG 1-like [Phalaenopsis equestris]
MVGVQRKPGKASRFTRPEMRHMEMLLREGKDLLDPKFHQKLADDFNRAPGRVENKPIQIQQVRRWFLNRYKLHKTEDATSRSSSKEMSPDGEESLTLNVSQSSDLPEENGEKVSEEVEMEFEARSSRDTAWYDVSTFLAHRVLSSGEVEVRVRFNGFGPEEDEWVNVRKSVRERSIPMESSECWKVKEGDIVLCFREKDEAAKYFDAHVVQVERKMHDIRGCRCIFLVRYDPDQTEERVHLSRLCRRP